MVQGDRYAKAGLVVAVTGALASGILTPGTAAAAPWAKAIASETATSPREGFRLVRDLQTGWCLDGNGSAVYTNPCDRGNPWQQWFVYGSRLTHRQTRTSLDSNEQGDVYLLEPNNGNYQSWRSGIVDTEIIDNETGRCLDSTRDHAVSTRGCNGGSNQKWAFEA